MSVTLSDLKSHLRITDTNEDSILQIYLDSAIDYLDTQTGRYLSQVAGRKAYFDCFGDLELIGDDPVIANVEYVDTDGATQALSTSVYALKAHKARPYITLAYNQSWPIVRSVDAAITVTYQSGFTSSTLPSSLKSAVLLVAGDFYEFREGQTIMQTYENKAVNRLMMPYKIYKL